MSSCIVDTILSADAMTPTRLAHRPHRQSPKSPPGLSLANREGELKHFDAGFITRRCSFRAEGEPT